MLRFLKSLFRKTPDHIARHDRKIRAQTKEALRLAAMTPQDPMRFANAGIVMFMEQSLEHARQEMSRLVHDEGFSVQGARAEAAKTVGAIVRATTNHEIATEFRRRFAQETISSLLNAKAKDKLYRETEVIRRAYCEAPSLPALPAPILALPAPTDSDSR